MIYYFHDFTHITPTCIPNVNELRRIVLHTRAAKDAAFKRFIAKTLNGAYL